MWLEASSCSCKKHDSQVICTGTHVTEPETLHLLVEILCVRFLQQRKESYRMAGVATPTHLPHPDAPWSPSYPSAPRVLLAL